MPTMSGTPPLAMMNLDDFQLQDAADSEQRGQNRLTADAKQAEETPERSHR